MSATEEFLGIAPHFPSLVSTFSERRALSNQYPYSHPAYVAEEALLRKNLRLIKRVEEATGAKILVAFKAFAQWRLFPIFKEEGFDEAAVSSLFEARLAYEELGKQGHAFSPAYTVEDFPYWKQYCSTITFNSCSQATQLLAHYPDSDRHYNLRINPGYSPVETALYNPAMPGSRFGVPAKELQDSLPHGVDGLHFHLLCEGNSFQLEKILSLVERDFEGILKKVKRLNMGGGHFVTHPEYNLDHLVSVLRCFSQKYPWIELTMEPGSAFALGTGYLVSHVVDLVKHDGIATAILDVSFTCHMPDCLEMPYQPAVRGAESLPLSFSSEKGVYRLGGNSCLSGDYLGCWRFEKPLSIGDEVILEDMLHYTMVKTTMFNGIAHPDLVLHKEDGSYQLLRHYDYDDYKQRMS